MSASVTDRLNALLDRIPRTTIRCGARRVPAFRGTGELGFVLAVLLLLALGLGESLSPSILAALAMVCGLTVVVGRPPMGAPPLMSVRDRSGRPLHHLLTFLAEAVPGATGPGRIVV